MLVAVGAFLLAVTFVPTLGCSDDGDERTPTTETRRTTTTERTSSTTTTTTPPTTEEAAEAAYVEAMTALLKAGESPDPDDEDVTRTHVGPSLVKAKELLQGFVDRGVLIEFPNGILPSPTVEGVELQRVDQALVTACLIDNARQVRQSDGSVVDDTVVSRSTRAEMRLVRDAWLLYAQESLNEWPDDEGCER